MSANATHRLVEAAAALGPVDRALMNLWIHRGLDDGRIAQLTGMDAAAVAERRGRLVAELSQELGLPPDDLVAALRALEPDPESAPASDGGADVKEPADPQPTVEAPADPEAQLEPSADPGNAIEPDVDPAPAPDRLPPLPPAASRAATRPRRSRTAALLTGGFVVIVIVAGVSIVLATSGGSSKSVARPSTPTASVPTTSVAAAAPQTSSTAATTSAHHRPAHRSTHAQSRRSTRKRARRPRRRSARLRPRPRLARLGGLPGGPRRVTGSVRLIGTGRHLRLRLRVKGLPHRRHSHYELWLYDSVIDSHALGRFQIGHGARTYRLPASARRYRSIDLSLQPRGTRAHSGESLLRAANPVRQTRRGGRGSDSKKDRTGP